MSETREVLFMGLAAVALVGVILVMTQVGIALLYFPSRIDTTVSSKEPIGFEYLFATASGEVAKGQTLSIPDRAVVDPNSSSIENSFGSISMHILYMLNSKFHFESETLELPGTPNVPLDLYPGYNGTLNGTDLRAIELLLPGCSALSPWNFNASIYVIGVEARDVNVTLLLPTNEQIDLGRSRLSNGFSMYQERNEGGGASGSGQWDATGYWGSEFNGQWMAEPSRWQLSVPELQDLLTGSGTARIVFDIMVRVDAEYEYLAGDLTEAGDISATTMGRLGIMEINYSDGKILGLRYDFSVIGLSILAYRKPVEGRNISQLEKEIQGSQAYKRGHLSQVIAENAMMMFNLRKEGFSMGMKTLAFPDNAENFRVGDKVVAARDLAPTVINGTRIDGSPFNWSGPAVPTSTKGIVTDVEHVSSEWLYYVRFQTAFGDIEIWVGKGDITKEQ